MNVDKNTVYINHDVETREECFGIIVTEFKGEPCINLIASRSGCTYAGPGALKGAMTVRKFAWTRGDKLRNEIHIVSVAFLTDMMLNNVVGLL